MTRHSPRRSKSTIRPQNLLRIERLEDRTTPTNFTVLNTDDTGAGSLREAIGIANATSGDDVITFDTALIGKTITITSAALPAITQALTINGPGRDKLTINGNKAFRVFELQNAGAVVITGMTITGGKVAGAGGGVLNNKSLLTLTSVTIAGNQTTGGGSNGGGVNVTGTGASLILTDSLIAGNSSNVNGGGINTDTGTTATIANSTIAGNTIIASTDGAGIDNNGTMTIADSLIAGNVGLQVFSFGGGIENEGTLTVTGCTITGNMAGRGGGISATSGTLKVINSTIASNTAFASDGGGGIFLISGTASISNSTIVRNADTTNLAEGAGGIAKTGGTLDLVNSIVSLNDAGPGSVNDNVDPADLNTNTSNFLGGNPQLGPLEDNGGPTPTMLPYPDSPVLNAGSDAAIPGGITTDQRGLPRIVSGGVDIGAVEFKAVSPTAGTPSAITPTIVVDSLLDGAPAADGKLTLREAVIAATTNAASGDAPAGTAGLDVIGFASSLFAGTIKLDAAQGELTLNGGGDVTIVGPSDVRGGIAISGEKAVRVFNVTAAATIVSFLDLTITLGKTAAAQNGGGLLNAGPDTTLTNVLVTQNVAAVNGGGIFNSGKLAIINTEVSNNSATTDDGGGIQNKATLTVTDTRIVGNRAASAGGGIDTRTAGAVTTIVGSLIAGNDTAAFAGGLEATETAKLIVSTSTIVGNRGATLGGGGIQVFGGATAEITNTTIAYNISGGGDGGGGISINSSAGAVTIAHATIVGNADTTNLIQGAGGIALQAGPTLSVVNSIVALNEAGPVSLSNNVDPADLTTNTTNFLTGNPFLGPLKDNGGPTPTFLPNPDSPVRNAGTNAAIPTGVTTDQRGFTRIANTTVDIGSVEVQILLNPTTLPNGTATVAYDQSISASGAPGSYSFTLTAGTLPFGLTLSSSGKISGTPTTAGAFNFTVTAANGTGESGSQAYTITIGPNTAPTITDIANQTTTDGVAVGPLAFTIGDAETAVDALTLSSASDNTTFVPLASITFGGTGADRTVTVTPATGQTGTATITITVTDAGGLTATDTFTVTVNAPPVITEILDQTTTDGTAVGPIEFAVSDAETPAGSLTVSPASNNTTLIPVANITIAGTGVARTVTITPAAGQTGTATITLTVTDAGGLTDSETFIVTVNPAGANTPPTISDITNQSTTVGVAVGPLAFSVNDNQTSAGALTVIASSSNLALVPNANITFGGSGTNRTVTVTPAAGQTGTTTITLTITDAGGLTATDTFSVVVTPIGGNPVGLVGPHEFGVGADTGGSAAQFYNPDKSLRFSLTPFPGFAGGVRTAAGDFNGDGVAELVVGTGPGRATQVLVLDGKTQAQIFSIDPFEASFTGGVYVAAGDVTGDGIADLVITPDEGGGPRARVFDGKNSFAVLADFFGIEDPNFRGGARPALGDVDGDGASDLVVAAGFLGGPRVAAFNGTSLRPGVAPLKLFNDFFAFEQTLRNGVFITIGDLDADGKAELIAGGGPGGGPRVTAFSATDLIASGGGTLTPLANFFAGDSNNRGGVRLTVKDLDSDAKADLVVGSGTGAGSRVTGYLGANIQPAGTPITIFDFDALPGFTGGVFVG